MRAIGSELQNAAPPKRRDRWRQSIGLCHQTIKLNKIATIRGDPFAVPIFQVSSLRDDSYAARSKIPAAPIPPPMHIVTIA